MRKLGGYLIGLVTMVATFAIICIAGILYDTYNKTTITPYFLRTGERSESLAGIPKPLSEIGQRKLRDWLIQKYVKEYLYIVPNVENLDATGLQSRTFKLQRMSGADAFDYWSENIEPELRNLAEQGVRRTVRVFDEIIAPEKRDYLRVEYELKTWYKPNDMTEVPEVTRGVMHVKIKNTDIHVLQPIENVQKFLDAGGDPAVVFSFKVEDVLMER